MRKVKVISGPASLVEPKIAKFLKEVPYMEIESCNSSSAWDDSFRTVIVTVTIIYIDNTEKMRAFYE
ncbi:hypothetical protein [Enterococcus sp. AZ196]|uniref:hypothetical protein n=1 Tax=Enterococcus sp. AZ196 TaxID=2774659 RepID=UPI003D2E2E65